MKNYQQTSHQIAGTMESEQAAVRKDMIQTVVVNLLFVGLLIGLYYWNQNSGQPLDNFVGRFINL